MREEREQMKARQAEAAAAAAAAAEPGAEENLADQEMQARFLARDMARKDAQAEAEGDRALYGRLRQIQESVEGCPDLVAPGRRCLKEGRLRLVEGAGDSIRDATLFL